MGLKKSIFQIKRNKKYALKMYRYSFKNNLFFPFGGGVDTHPGLTTTPHSAIMLATPYIIFAASHIMSDTPCIMSAVLQILSENSRSFLLEPFPKTENETWIIKMRIHNSAKFHIFLGEEVDEFKLAIKVSDGLIQIYEIDPNKSLNEKTFPKPEKEQ